MFCTNGIKPKLNNFIPFVDYFWTMHNESKYIRKVDIIIMIFIFFVLFILPVIFLRENNRIEWRNIQKIWQDQFLLLPLFAINHWLLVPKLILKKKYITYLITCILLIASFTSLYYVFDELPSEGSYTNRRSNRGLPPPPHKARPHHKRIEDRSKPPKPVPPYANLLVLSLMIVSIDSGLSFTKHWHKNEQDKVRLEKESIESQLGMLRNQISPHFFMNTLNNIYSLIGGDIARSRQAVMKLSKLMRYLLYENKDGKVLLSKEFEFLRSYVDLMKLRFSEDVDINLRFPEKYPDVKIPVNLFISYLENAFKYGTSYQHRSFISTSFKIDNNHLVFECENSVKGIQKPTSEAGGIGLENSRQRLDLLYNENYNLNIHKTDETFTVILKLPLEWN